MWAQQRGGIRCPSESHPTAGRAHKDTARVMSSGGGGGDKSGSGCEDAVGLPQFHQGAARRRQAQLRRRLPRYSGLSGQLKNKYGDAFIRGNNAHPSAPLQMVHEMVTQLASSVSVLQLHQL
ncbi:uncharacterized protein LOC133918983 [Phragmites australis]|uniref:uncharacterized protein LOC133918983 n=1 Tax=Phragmites australis TaxID=29695 RepID=UPI002D76D720|nr:uncharacterized protein LOC133918983 [Phragmites australis]